MAEATGYTAAWIRRIARRYNESGGEGLGDRRHNNPGGVERALLTGEQKAELGRALQSPLEGGGLWSGRKAAEWIGEKTGRGGVRAQEGCGIPARARLHTAEAAPGAREGGPAGAGGVPGKIGRRVVEVGSAHPRQAVELWTMDEHRLGLKPVLRKVRAKRGHRPVVRVHHRYEWVYVYCFVRPSTGDTCWLLMPEVSSAAFSLALAHFARQVGAGEGKPGTRGKQVVLVLDGAGYHTGGGVRVPGGIELESLPPYSPELRPAEHLWPLTDEGIANALLTSLGVLEEALARRIVALADQPELISSTTLYHRWPRTA